jgi:isoleucyl-tRNA synthetase
MTETNQDPAAAVQTENKSAVAKREEMVLRFWQKNSVFQKSQDQRQGAEAYVIYDGPPTANALPPLHTITPMSFKDATGRFQAMHGKYVRRQLGWDTHGLPVEVQVEKAKGLGGKKDILALVLGDESASIAAFNEACRTSVWEYKQAWDQFVPRTGYWADTENPYITYDTNYVEGVWSVFKRVWEKQTPRGDSLVYKDYKVLPYCPRCGTGLSAAELALEYQDDKDVAVYVIFPWVTRPERSFVAWTTTPWTLPGNVALALGAEITYAVIKTIGKTGQMQELILAKDRLGILTEDYVVIEEILGKDLLGIQYQPLFEDCIDRSLGGNAFITVAADFVTDTDGSGVVHTACMYGDDDFQLAKKADLCMQHTVDLNGVFMEHVPDFAGMYVHDALGPILTSLQEKNRLLKKESITHSYPHCWRCKTKLLYYAKESWYIAMSQLREQLVAANTAVEWIPEHIQTGRFGGFIAEARDWAVSRERYWGTPMPVWTSTEGKHLCVGSIAELRELAENPELIPENFDPHRPFVDQIVLVKGGHKYYREPYVLDVWFDSGAMPYASGREAQSEFPADFIAEAIDQTRGWMYTLMALGVILHNKAPYKRVICMGHLVDEQGRKMSKSIGNVLVPQEVFDEVGADAVRWFIYTVNSPGESKAISLKELHGAYRRGLALIENMYQFLATYAPLNNFTPPTDFALTLQQPDLGLTELDRWVLARTNNDQALVTQYMHAGDMMRAGRTLESLIADCSTWYLRRSRKRTDKAFFTTLHAVLRQITMLAAPLAPFLTEYMWQGLRTGNDPQSVHLADWPGQIWTSETDDATLAIMEEVRAYVELGLRARAEMKQKIRQPLAVAVLLGEAANQFTADHHEILIDELNVLTVVTDGDTDGYSSATDSVRTVALDPVITSALEQAGFVRELTRQIQNMRKTSGLQPGQVVHLVIGPDWHAQLAPLFDAYPQITMDCFLKVGETTWEHLGAEEIKVNGQTIPISLVA